MNEQKYKNLIMQKGSTPLMQAIEFNNSTKLVEALLGAGAKINTRDFVDNTALHFAALEGRAGWYATLFLLYAELTLLFCIVLQCQRWCTDVIKVSKTTLSCSLTSRA